MDPITLEQLQEAIATRGITVWALRRCSICGTEIGYSFPLDAPPHFHSACDCSRYTGATPPQPRDFDDVLDTFNRQTPAVRARMWEQFITKGSPE